MDGIPVISVEQMRRWEAASWASGAKEADVIAAVGQAVARRVLELTEPGDSILLLAGKGHNGDDVRAAAPHLTGRHFTLLDVADPETARAEWASAISAPPAWIVDGLFGMGLNRPLNAAWQEFIHFINGLGVPILAVDVPSGLNAETGQIEGAAIQAAITLTVGAPKRGLLGAAPVGRLEVAAHVGLAPIAFESELHWTMPEDFARCRPTRAAQGHKGSYGHVAILAGSLGYHGAAVLASHGALRAQPGLVSVYPQPDAWLPVASQSQAAMVHPWQAGKALPPTCTAALIGPGMAAKDVPESFKKELRALWNTSPLTVIVDASALSWLAGGPTPLGAVRVITPHPGEAGRLLDKSSAAIQADRPAALREISRHLGGCHVVLKGEQTLVGSAEGPIFVNSSGNPFLAQGGSGDLLGGYIAGLLAQPDWRKNALTALRFAVWQHGAAADHLTRTQANWTIEDLARALGNVPVPRR